VRRLNKIISFLNVEEDVKATLMLVKMIFFLCVYMHCFACAWWLMVSTQKNWIAPILSTMDQTHFYDIYQPDYPNSSQYMLSLFTAVQFLLGGDFIPISGA
jgi:hypothetical protein